MEKLTYLEMLRKEIESNKKNVIEEISKEEIIPAMHSITSLIDLKAQENALKKEFEQHEE